MELTKQDLIIPLWVKID